MESKKAFLFYASNLDVLEQFPEEEAGRLALVIMEYGFADESFECSQDDRDLLHHVFIGIDREKKRYKTGQTISDTITSVSNLTRARGFTEKEIEDALQNLKRLKAKAHRQDVTQGEINNAIGMRIFMTLRLEGANPFYILKLSINDCKFPGTQSNLMNAFDSLVKHLYSSKNVQPPKYMLFNDNGV